MAEEKMICKGCGKSYTRLLTHLNQTDCNLKYTTEEINQIKVTKDQERKAYKQNHNKNYYKV